MLATGSGTGAADGQPNLEVQNALNKDGGDDGDARRDINLHTDKVEKVPGAGPGVEEPWYEICAELDMELEKHRSERDIK
ncbi:hypothetical protein AKJ16_DCAP07095 [Drosera capensis]